MPKLRLRRVCSAIQGFTPFLHFCKSGRHPLMYLPHVFDFRTASAMKRRCLLSALAVAALPGRHRSSPRGDAQAPGFLVGPRGSGVTTHRWACCAGRHQHERGRQVHHALISDSVRCSEPRQQNSVRECSFGRVPGRQIRRGCWHVCARSSPGNVECDGTGNSFNLRRPRRVQLSAGGQGLEGAELSNALITCIRCSRPARSVPWSGSSANGTISRR